MTDFDLDRLGDVWRQQPGPAEMERLQRSAAAVARRARISQVVDVVVGLAVAGIVIFLVASNPKPGTVLIGSAAILILLTSNIRLRKMRRIELGHLTGGTEEMLDQSIVRMETSRRHHRFSLIGIVPAVAAGILVANGSQGRNLLPMASDSWVRSLLVPLGILVVLGGVTFSLRAMRRARQELERLRAMREAYRRERESTTS
jgi:hypothetical protein